MRLTNTSPQGPETKRVEYLDGKIQITIQNAVGKTYEGLVADIIRFDSCQGIKIGSNTCKKMYVTNSYNVLMNGISFQDAPSNDWALEVLDSPFFTMTDSMISGAGMRVQDSYAPKIKGCQIDTWGSSKEGIRLSGCNDFTIDDCDVEGDIAEESGVTGNDLIQIENSYRVKPDPKHTFRDPFKWPNRDELIFDEFDDSFMRGEDGELLPDHRVYRGTWLNETQHAGKTQVYAEKVDDWQNGGQIVNCRLSNARIACIFLLRTRNVIVANNIFKNSRDYHCGAEWAEDCEIRDNISVQEDKWIGVGSGGGISLMHYIKDCSVRNNVMRNCNISVRGWGFPVIRPHIVGNTIYNGKIWFGYGSTVWHKDILIKDNYMTRGRIEISASPFYTTGIIEGNTLLDGRERELIGISLEGFRGVLRDNLVYRAERKGAYAIRDFNVGPERLTSVVLQAGNYVNDVLAPLSVYKADRPPVPATYEAPATPDGSPTNPGGTLTDETL